jgi:hypothetical protein
MSQLPGGEVITVATHYNIMMFPGEGLDGGYAYSLRIENLNGSWTSPLVKLSTTDAEEARAEAQAQVSALIKVIIVSEKG